MPAADAPVAPGSVHDGAQVSPAAPAAKDDAFLAAPSLPRGGGALRGIGETFTVNPAHGTSSLSVPLAVSPGRGGARPPVSLSYDSGGGNSAFGLGFRLTLPSIARRTRKGIPTYSDADVFVLAGAEDLVPDLAAQSGGGWSVEPHPATVDGIACVVQRFRPRVEGDFTRIERCRPVAGGADFWRVTSRDNAVSLFGRTAQARISAPGAPDQVFEWLLETVSDDRGNLTTYTPTSRKTWPASTRPPSPSATGSTGRRPSAATSRPSATETPRRDRPPAHISSSFSTTANTIRRRKRSGRGPLAWTRSRLTGRRSRCDRGDSATGC